MGGEVGPHRTAVSAALNARLARQEEQLVEELFATRFCLLHWKLFEILRRFVRKADSFQRASQRSPRALRDVEHKSQMHLHWAPRPSLFYVPPLCQHHLLRESFFNTSCIADIMKWPPDRPTDGSLPQSPWNRPLIFPSMPLSIRLPYAAITSPAFSHNIPLRAFVFPIIFARLSLFVDFYYFTWRLLCS